MTARFLGYLAGAVCVVVALVGCGKATDRSSQIADAIGAERCVATDYEITFRVGGSHPRIYDCNVGGAAECVTWEGGGANDRTELARLLFASRLSGSRPDCAS